MIVYQLNYDPTVGFYLTENIFKEQTDKFLPMLKNLHDIITKGNGRTMPEHFDPDLLEVCKKYSDRLEGIYNYFKEEAGVS